jgi:hypothetical protein|tara:strand:+ start:3890 stop:4330 length:441 start_codon:yes stop_codon:yes gene_type:complete
MLKKAGIALLGVFIIIQFFRIDKTNPEYNEAEDFITITQPPTEIASLIKLACYDCHSHQAKYPWYSNIAPVSWMVANHIKEGRAHLNFSTWTTYPEKKADHKLEECAEELEAGDMPMKSYVVMHREAKMTDAQKTALVEWFESQRI